MTEQLTETLFYKGIKHLLLCEPLAQFLKEHRRHMRFHMPGTTCSRGYRGTWEVVDGKLYLTKLEGQVDIRKTVETGPVLLDATHEDVFPDSTGPVFAEWFSGELLCVFGEVQRDTRDGYGAVSRHERLLEVRNGVVVGESVRVREVQEYRWQLTEDTDPGHNEVV